MPRADLSRLLARAKKIAAGLNALRKSRGWSVRTLAQEADVDKDTASRATRGLRTRKESLKKLAGALDTTVENLYRGSLIAEDPEGPDVARSALRWECRLCGNDYKWSVARCPNCGVERPTLEEGKNATEVP